MKDQFPDFSAAGGCLLTENGRQGMAGFLLDRIGLGGSGLPFRKKKGVKSGLSFPAFLYPVVLLKIKDQVMKERTQFLGGPVAVEPDKDMPGQNVGGKRVYFPVLVQLI
jgi:hypothetical protein